MITIKRLGGGTFEVPAAMWDSAMNKARLELQ